MDGNEMTGYEASQAMRRLETAVRKQKGVLTMAKAAGDKALTDECNERINKYSDKYKKISEATKVARDDKRMDLTKGWTSGIINEKKTSLPRAEHAEISKNKFTEYALNPLKDENKAKAFKSALGYTAENVDELIANIRGNLNNFTAVEKNNNGYGKRYEVLMTLTGANGKRANVKTAWIIDKDADNPRLTSAYVTKKKFKEE